MMENANRGNMVRRLKGGESVSPTNPKKVRAGNLKKKKLVSLIKETTGAGKICLLHVHAHYSEDCKVLQE